MISGHKEIHEITRKRRNDASRHPISVSPRYLTTELDKTRALYPLNEATFFLAISNCHDDDGRARKCGITQRERGGGQNPFLRRRYFNRGRRRKSGPHVNVTLSFWLCQGMKQILVQMRAHATYFIAFQVFMISYLSSVWLSLESCSLQRCK